MKRPILFFAALISALIITSVCKAQPGIIYTIAGNGTAAYAGNGLSATTAEVNGPDGVAIDAAGNIYFYDHRDKSLTLLGF